MQRLIPFIVRHHEIEDVLFCPDLTRIRFAKIVKEELHAPNPDFASKIKKKPTKCITSKMDLKISV